MERFVSKGKREFVYRLRRRYEYPKHEAYRILHDFLDEIKSDNKKKQFIQDDGN